VGKVSFRLPIYFLSSATAARAQKANPTVVYDHFKKLRNVVDRNSLTADKIYNMDETGFNIIPRLQKVLAAKNSRQVHKIANVDTHEHVSVCTTISADGSYIPPLFIFKGSRVVANLLQGAPRDSVIAFTEKYGIFL